LKEKTIIKIGRKYLPGKTEGLSKNSTPGEVIENPVV